MKKILPLIIIGLLMGISSFAQSLVIKDKSGEVVTGQSIDFICPVVTGYAFQSLGLDVFNTSNLAKNVKVRRYYNSVADSSEVSICWLSCYPSHVWETPDPIAIDPGAFSTNFTGDITYYSPQGTTAVKFVFFDMDNTADSSFVIVNYVIGALGIPTEPFNQIRLSNAYPNPASNNVNIDYRLPANISEASIKVTNLLGTIIDNVMIDKTEGKAILNVNSLKNGIYFYSLIINNSATITRKFVVKR